MESNWRFNVADLCADEYDALLVARLVGFPGNVLMKLPWPDGTWRGFIGTILPGETCVPVTLVASPGPGVRFPYGFAVEPD